MNWNNYTHGLRTSCNDGKNNTQQSTGLSININDFPPLGYTPSKRPLPEPDFQGFIDSFTPHKSTHAQIKTNRNRYKTIQRTEARRQRYLERQRRESDLAYEAHAKPVDQPQNDSENDFAGLTEDKVVDYIKLFNRLRGKTFQAMKTIIDRLAKVELETDQEDDLPTIDENKELTPDDVREFSRFKYKSIGLKPNQLAARNKGHLRRDEQLVADRPQLPKFERKIKLGCENKPKDYSEIYRDLSSTESLFDFIEPDDTTPEYQPEEDKRDIFTYLDKQPTLKLPAAFKQSVEHIYIPKRKPRIVEHLTQDDTNLIDIEIEDVVEPQLLFSPIQLTEFFEVDEWSANAGEDIDPAKVLNIDFKTSVFYTFWDTIPECFRDQPAYTADTTMVQAMRWHQKLTYRKDHEAWKIYFSTIYDQDNSLQMKGLNSLLRAACHLVTYDTVAEILKVDPMHIIKFHPDLDPRSIGLMYTYLVAKAHSIIDAVPKDHWRIEWNNPQIPVIDYFPKLSYTNDYYEMAYKPKTKFEWHANAGTPKNRKNHSQAPSSEASSSTFVTPETTEREAEQMVDPNNMEQILNRIVSSEDESDANGAALRKAPVELESEQIVSRDDERAQIIDDDDEYEDITNRKKESDAQKVEKRNKSFWTFSGMVDSIKEKASGATTYVKDKVNETIKLLKDVYMGTLAAEHYELFDSFFHTANFMLQMAFVESNKEFWSLWSLYITGLGLFKIGGNIKSYYNKWMANAEDDSYQANAWTPEWISNLQIAESLGAMYESMLTGLKGYGFDLKTFIEWCKNITIFGAAVRTLKDFLLWILDVVCKSFTWIATNVFGFTFPSEREAFEKRFQGIKEAYIFIKDADNKTEHKLGQLMRIQIELDDLMKNFPNISKNFSSDSIKFLRKSVEAYTISLLSKRNRKLIQPRAVFCYTYGESGVGKTRSCASIAKQLCEMHGWDDKDIYIMPNNSALYHDQYHNEKIIIIEELGQIAEASARNNLMETLLRMLGDIRTPMDVADPQRKNEGLFNNARYVISNSNTDNPTSTSNMINKNAFFNRVNVWANKININEYDVGVTDLSSMSGGRIAKIFRADQTALVDYMVQKYFEHEDKYYQLLEDIKIETSKTTLEAARNRKFEHGIDKVYTTARAPITPSVVSNNLEPAFEDILKKFSEKPSYFSGPIGYLTFGISIVAMACVAIHAYRWSKAEEPMEANSDDTNGFEANMYHSGEQKQGHKKPNKKYTVARFKKLANQAHAASTSNADTARTQVENNLAFIKGTNCTMFGIFVKHKTLLLPAHFFTLDRLDSEGKHNFTVFRTTKDGKQHQTTARIGKDEILVAETRDIAFVTINDPNFPAAKDIINSFIHSSSLDYNLSNVSYLAPKGGGGLEWNTTTNAVKVGDLSYNVGSLYTMDTEFLIRIPVHMAKGDCGLPIVVNNNSVRGNILGIHNAGKPKKPEENANRASWQIVTYEDIMSALYPPEEYRANAKEEIRFGSSAYNVTKEPIPVRLSDKTKLSLNIYNLDLTQVFGPAKKIPAALTPIEVNGKIVRPMELCIQDMTEVPKIPINYHIRRATVAISDLLPVCESDYIITETQNFNGDASMNLKAPDYSTSAGIPYIYNGIVSKKSLVIREGEIWIPTDALRDSMDKLETMYHRAVALVEDAVDHKRLDWEIQFGEFEEPMPVANYLKDETRSIAKVEAGITRPTKCYPFQFTTVFRKYFAAPTSCIAAESDSGIIAVGINPLDPSRWAMRGNALRLRGDKQKWNIVAGDMKGYDRSVSRTFILAAITTIMKWLKTTNDEINTIRLNLLLAVFDRKEFALNYSWRIDEGIPTGHPWTAQFNSIVLALAVYSSISEIYETKGVPFDARTFSVFFKLTSFGDDFVLTVHPSVTFVNMITMQTALKKCGFNMTHPSKTKEITEPYMSIEELRFLGRAWRYQSDYYCDGPLDRETVEEIPRYVSAILDPKKAAKLSFECALREASVRGREEYEELRFIYNSILKKNGVALIPDSYESYLMDRNSGNFFVEPSALDVKHFRMDVLEVLQDAGFEIIEEEEAEQYFADEPELFEAHCKDNYTNWNQDWISESSEDLWEAHSLAVAPDKTLQATKTERINAPEIIRLGAMVPLSKYDGHMEFPEFNVEGIMSRVQDIGSGVVAASATPPYTVFAYGLPGANLAQQMAQVNNLTNYDQFTADGIELIIQLYCSPLNTCLFDLCIGENILVTDPLFANPPYTTSFGKQIIINPATSPVIKVFIKNKHPRQWFRVADVLNISGALNTCFGVAQLTLITPITGATDNTAEVKWRVGASFKGFRGQGPLLTPNATTYQANAGSYEIKDSPDAEESFRIGGSSSGQTNNEARAQKNYGVSNDSDLMAKAKLTNTYKAPQPEAEKNRVFDNVPTGFSQIGTFDEQPEANIDGSDRATAKSMRPRVHVMKEAKDKSISTGAHVASGVLGALAAIPVFPFNVITGLGALIAEGASMVFHLFDRTKTPQIMPAHYFIPRMLDRRNNIDTPIHSSTLGVADDAMVSTEPCDYSDTQDNMSVASFIGVWTVCDIQKINSTTGALGVIVAYNYGPSYTHLLATGPKRFVPRPDTVLAGYYDFSHGGAHFCIEMACNNFMSIPLIFIVQPPNNSLFASYTNDTSNAARFSHTFTSTNNTFTFYCPYLSQDYFTPCSPDPLSMTEGVVSTVNTYSHGQLLILLSAEPVIPSGESVYFVVKYRPDEHTQFLCPRNNPRVANFGAPIATSSGVLTKPTKYTKKLYQPATFVRASEKKIESKKGDKFVKVPYEANAKYEEMQHFGSGTTKVYSNFCSGSSTLGLMALGQRPWFEGQYSLNGGATQRFQKDFSNSTSNRTFFDIMRFFREWTGSINIDFIYTPQFFSSASSQLMYQNTTACYDFDNGTGAPPATYLKADSTTLIFDAWKDRMHTVNFPQYINQRFYTNQNAGHTYAVSNNSEGYYTWLVNPGTATVTYSVTTRKSIGPDFRMWERSYPGDLIASS